MNTNTNPGIDTWAESADVVGCARALEDASRNLCRVTLTRPHLTPDDVDVILAHLAAAAATLPQAAHRLSDILDDARSSQSLAMDTLSDTQDPDLAIDTARLHLDATREPAVSLYRHLDAARQQTAHIAIAVDQGTGGRAASKGDPELLPRRHERHRPLPRSGAANPAPGGSRSD